METINKDIFLIITEYLDTKDNYFFVSSMTGKMFDMCFLTYRENYFRKISAVKLNCCFFENSSQVLLEEINCLHYYNNLNNDDFINCEILDFTFCWLSDKMNEFLKNENVHKFQSQNNNYFHKKMIKKKIAYSTGLRDKVFIKNNALVCSIYGCKMLGSTRRKIMRSPMLKALIG